MYELINGVRKKVGFTNLYAIFFYRAQSPSGLLAIIPSGFIFILGMTDPRENLPIDFTDQPKNRKNRLTEVGKKYNLRWYGDVRNPAVFRYESLNEHNLKTFVEDLLKFFNEVGFAEI